MYMAVLGFSQFFPLLKSFTFAKRRLNFYAGVSFFGIDRALFLILRRSLCILKISSHEGIRVVGNGI